MKSQPNVSLGLSGEAKGVRTMNTIQGFLLNVFSARGLTVAVALGFLVMAPLPTLGAVTNRTWTAADGNWSNTANWTSNNVPDATTENAVLSDVGSGTRTVTMDASYTINQLCMTQATVSDTNKLVLGGTLNIPTTTPLSLSSPAGINNLVLDLSGYALTSSSGSSIANPATLIGRSGSTLNFTTLNNTGYLEMGTNALFGAATTSRTLNNSGTFNVTGTGAALGNTAYGAVGTLLNTGTMNVGLNGTPATFSLGGDSFLFTNAATLTVGPGSTIYLSFTTGNGVPHNFFNTATAAFDNATLAYNGSVYGNNNGTTHNFNNSGLWTLQNSSQVIRSGNTSGVGIPTGANSGTLRVLSGSTMTFGTLNNTGYLEVGTNATLGDLFPILNNTAGGIVKITGINAALGSTITASFTGASFYNGSSSGQQGATFTVGDGTNAASFFMYGNYRDAVPKIPALYNFAGDTVTVTRASTLGIVFINNANGVNGWAYITNGGVVFNSGTIQFTPNNTPSWIDNKGTFSVGSGNVATGVVQNLPSYNSVGNIFYNRDTGVLTGNGLYLFTNYTGSASYNYENFQNAGTIAPTIGGTLTLQNVIINNTGIINPNNSSLILANANLTNSAIVSIQNGGLLEANTFVQLAGGTMTNFGGVNQFSIANPTVSRATADTIVLTNGAISFRAITNADVYANGNGTVGNQLTNILYQGTNAFRLDAASNTLAKSQTYTFASNLGPTNYARLELLNGAMYRNGNVTIGTNGTLLVSNGVSTVSGTLTFDPTATLSVDLSKTSGYGALIAQSNVNLNGCALNINLGSAPVPGSSFMIISNSAGATSGSFGTSRQVVTVNGTNYVVRINIATNGVSLNSILQTRGMRLIIE